MIKVKRACCSSSFCGIVVLWYYNQKCPVPKKYISVSIVVARNRHVFNGWSKLGNILTLLYKKRFIKVLILLWTNQNWKVVGICCVWLVEVAIPLPSSHSEPTHQKNLEISLIINRYGRIAKSDIGCHYKD